MGAARKVTIGADPEIPVGLMHDESMLMQWYPATGVFGGDKGKPVVQGPEGGWLEDGAMLELNPTPTEDPNNLADNIETLFNKADAHARTRSDVYGGRKYRLGLVRGVPVVNLEDEFLRKYPQLGVFGCAQDFSAYAPGIPRGQIMESAMEEMNPGVRFAGGHLHIGITDWPEELPKFIAVKFMDLFFYLPYIAYYAQALDRDRFYGKAGLYRETKYGIEYRTPDPQWLRSTGKVGVTPKIDRRALIRFFEIGVLLSRFEQYKKDLVDIYNKIPWAELEQMLTHRASGDAFDLLRRASVLNDLYRVQLEDVQVHCSGWSNIFPEYKKKFKEPATVKVNKPHRRFEVRFAEAGGGVDNVRNFVAEVAERPAQRADQPPGGQDLAIMNDDEINALLDRQIDRAENVVERAEGNLFFWDLTFADGNQATWVMRDGDPRPVLLFGGVWNG